MNILIISILGIVSFSLPSSCSAGSQEQQEQETPLALPLAPQTEPTTSQKIYNTNSKNIESHAVTSPESVAAVAPAAVVAAVASSQADTTQEKTGSEIWQEDDREVLIRNVRGTKNNGEETGTSCRYIKSPWSECDTKTNTRSRTLTLKKGEKGCVPTRTIQKKCKKACRYEKGSWSECITGQMTRTDKLKPTSDPFCQTTRVINKNCNQGKFKDKSTKERKMKEKGARKGY